MALNSKQQQATNALSNSTLAGIMTSGIGEEQANNADWGAGQNYNIYGDYSTNVWPIQRVGLIQNVQGAIQGGQVYGCYFQYNPSEITVNWNFNPTTTPPYQFLTGSGSQLSTSDQANLSYFGYGNSATATTGAVALLTGQTLAWSLIFDRTYDMVYGNPNGSRGVLQDVAALYNVLGAFETVGATPLSLPVQVCFGMNLDGTLWGFTGNINSLTITYGIFRYDMIPSRCEIDIQMQIHYVAPSINSAIASAAGFTSSSSGSAQNAINSVTNAGNSAAGVIGNATSAVGGVNGAATNIGNLPGGF